MKKLYEIVNIGGLFFNNLTIDEAVIEIDKKINSYKKNDQTGLVCFANQDTISRLNNIKDFTVKNLNKSFLILPDGASIVLAGKLLGKKIKERVAGPDLMVKMIDHAAVKGYKNFFLGAKEGIAQKMSDNFKKKYPDLKVSGVYSPPFGDFTEKENNKIIELINKNKPDLLWVSFGCPKQEKWILKNASLIQVPVSLGVGAAFDFYAGNIKRAPLFLQKTGLEWLYRFFQEPSRLFNRYFIGGFKFLFIIIKQLLFKNNYEMHKR